MSKYIMTDSFSASWFTDFGADDSQIMQYAIEWNYLVLI